jgi:hypothetical protein
MGATKEDALGDQADRILLSTDFEPSCYSVICGRGKECFDSIGNRRFRVIVSLFIAQYSASRSKLAKSIIVSNIVDTIRSAGGGFVKFEDGAWWEVSDANAREKVGALIRDYLYTKYKSAAKSKMARRKARRRRREETDTEDNDSGSNSKSNLWISSKHVHTGADYCGSLFHSDNEDSITVTSV